MESGLAAGRPDHHTRLAGDLPFLLVSSVLFIASAAGTVFWSRSMPGMTQPDMDPPGPWLGGAAVFLGMWAVMMAAMMLPSLAPSLLSYRRVWRSLGLTNLGAPTALAGAIYLLVWTAFGVIAYPLSSGLAAAQMQSMAVGPIAAGLALLLAGAYQFTPFKTRQLECCRDGPASSSVGGPNGWRVGLSLGMHCVVCCAGFMAVLLATDVMNLGIMAAVAAAITLERLAPRPKLIARALGVAMVLIGVVVLAGAIRMG